WLTQHGYRVICAKDGEAALAQLKAADDRVDLVLTDLAMPGMGGERLVALLRRRNPALRIIVMSGRDLETSGSPSASGFLRKPFTGEELLAALKWRPCGRGTGPVADWPYASSFAMGSASSAVEKGFARNITPGSSTAV